MRCCWIRNERAPKDTLEHRCGSTVLRGDVYCASHRNILENMERQQVILA